LKKIIFLIILSILSYSLIAEAVPVQYTISGVIREADTSSVWDLTGSFLLSDPMITYNLYGDAPDDPYLENLVEFTLTDVIFQTDAFVLEGTGRFFMKEFDRIDRYYFFYLDDYYNSDQYNPLSFNGQSIYQQPERIGPLAFELFSDNPAGHTRCYTVENLEARKTSSVPEPSTILLFCAGIATVIAVRKNMSKR
jgi:hypothetical protein